MGSTTLTAQQVEDVLAGLWYVNIHTDLHPAGEIRGQVMPALLDNPLEALIDSGDIHVRLEPVADGLTAPNWGAAAPGGQPRPRPERALSPVMALAPLLRQGRGLLLRSVAWDRWP